jgi:two-component system OmpR family response regulator
MTSVLIVDDEPDIRVLVRMALERVGHTVLEAASGAEALDVLQHNVLDVLLLDVRMPGLTGWDVLARLGPRTPGTRPRVIMLSAHVDAAARAQATAAGAVYMSKPFLPRELVAAIGAITEG